MNTIGRAVQLRKLGYTLDVIVENLQGEGRVMRNGKPVTKGRIDKKLIGIKPIDKYQKRTTVDKGNPAEIEKMKAKAVELKTAGYTINEVILKLQEEFQAMPNGKPITQARIYPWVKGINSQKGYRTNGDCKPLTEKEKLIHRQESRDRKKAYHRKWMQEHRDILTRKLQ